jgi:hypothetical protein
VTVYHGCGVHNVDGVCWSLDRAVAERFPTLNRYRVDEPLLVTAQVDRNDVLAVKLNRYEMEIITFRPQISKVEKLTAIAEK